jgi:protein tyrosine phosphatase (PTP) superfamily phosphohydrolase (DUF442 family)
MPRSLPASLLAAALVASLAACAPRAARDDAASLPTTPAAPLMTTTPPAVPDFLARSLAADGAIVGAQPAADDIPAIAGAGVTRVLNLRTPEEMAALGYDEAALFQSAGVAYAQSPVGGAAGFSGDVVDAYERERQAANGGTVLLHCASGARAGAVHAAWLVRYRGATPTEAMQAVAPLGLWPLPLERLLGTPLRLELQTQDD